MKVSGVGRTPSPRRCETEITEPSDGYNSVKIREGGGTKAAHPGGMKKTRLRWITCRSRTFSSIYQKRGDPFSLQVRPA